MKEELPSFDDPLTERELKVVERFRALALEIAYHAHIMALEVPECVGEVVAAAARIADLADECKDLWWKTWGAGNDPDFDANGELRGYDRPFMYREFGSSE